MKGDDLKNLEYSKATRHFEDELNLEAEIEDLDESLLNAYKKKIGAEELDTIQVFEGARVYQEKRWTRIFYKCSSTALC